MNTHGVRIILAPSGAGKTTFAKGAGAALGAIDGDSIAYRGLRLDHEWWTKPEAGAIHRASQGAVAAYTGPGRVVLWNTHPTKEFMAMVDAIVIPPVQEYIRNHAARGAAAASASRAGAQPVFGEEKAAQQLAEWKDVAAQYGVATYSDFESAVRAVLHEAPARASEGPPAAAASAGTPGADAYGRSAEDGD